MQRAMVETWERHTAAEFATKSIDATMGTMTAEPVVNHVPVPLSRTVGANRIVDELIYKFTHTIEMPWMLPGVPPPGSTRKSQWWSWSNSKGTRSAASASTGIRPPC